MQCSEIFEESPAKNVNKSPLEKSLRKICGAVKFLKNLQPEKSRNFFGNILMEDMPRSEIFEESPAKNVKQSALEISFR